MSQVMNGGEPAAFPGRQGANVPVPHMPLCHFRDWPVAPDARNGLVLPIGSAADGPDRSGKPLEYARYLVYGLDVPRRRVWVQVDCYMVPSAGGIDGYVAMPPELQATDPSRRLFFVELAQLRSATVHHRTGTAPSALHTDRCDHPLVRNGEILADHAGHQACFELYVCRHRAVDLERTAREHGDACTYWSLDTGFCDDRQTLAADIARQSEHAYVLRLTYRKITFHHRTGDL